MPTTQKYKIGRKEYCTLCFCLEARLCIKAQCFQKLPHKILFSLISLKIYNEKSYYEITTNL